MGSPAQELAASHPVEAPAKLSTEKAGDYAAKHLWMSDVGSQAPDYQQEAYTKVLLDQYKLYVASADKNSDRRMLANNFFLTLNTGVAAGIGYMLVQSRDSTSIQIACLSCLAAFSICLIWILLLKSYRDLNAVKFRIIGELETRLPASPFWAAEWRALEQGKNESKYWPLSHLEMGIPWIVAVFYIVLGSLCVHLMLNTRPADPDSGVPVPPSGIPAALAPIEGGLMPK